MVGRPRGDRAERIMVTAARLFRERGFHATTIDDIGRAEGISGPAVYRHFASKDDLLAAVVSRGARHIVECLEAAGSGQAAEDRLTELLRAGGHATIDDLDTIMVYLREGRHLTAAHRRSIAALAAAVDDPLIAAVRAVRPELSRRHAGFMLQSFAGMYRSVGYFHPNVIRSRLVDIWATMGTAAVLGAPDVPVEAGRSPDVPAPARQRGSRREVILTEATTLFRRHGYGGVGVDDIGAAAGIAGPGVYRYFGNKDDVLAATMGRSAEQLAASAANALTATDPEVALDRLVESYVQLAVEHADAVAVYLAEVESLTDPRRREIRRAQRAYIADWRMLVTQLAPDHDSDDVRVAVHSAIGLVNGYADGRVRPPVDVTRQLLVAMTRSALDGFIQSAPPAAERRTSGAIAPGAGPAHDTE